MGWRREVRPQLRCLQERLAEVERAIHDAKVDVNGGTHYWGVVPREGLKDTVQRISMNLLALLDYLNLEAQTEPTQLVIRAKATRKAGGVRGPVRL